MRITSANIGMESARTARTTTSSVRKFTVTTGGTGAFTGLLSADTNTSEEMSGAENSVAERKEEKSAGETLSDYLTTMRKRVDEIRTGRVGYNAYSEEGREQMHRIREECINYLLALFFPNRYQSYWDKYGSFSSSGSSNTFDAFGLSSGKVQTYTLSQEYYYEESEDTSFETTGTVRTADGREIDFNLKLDMSRRFQEYYAEEVQSINVNLCDPLVINLEGDIPELSDQTFYFDIDGDGVEDEISKLIAGSGFLALDKNDDGVINDGTELFGTSSGNGFEDLRAYDEDGNGFIDEGDEVFDKLKIWAMNEQGEMQLYSLKEKGVGAISLQNAATQFSLNSMEDNHTNGVIRSTGVFLYENGNVGTVQQVDFAKHGQGNAKMNEALAAYA